jgi:hypothetical protein
LNGARPPYERQVVTGMSRKRALSRARRLRHAQTWDGIEDEEILERDGWRCQIPGCKRRPIRQDLKYPHPRSKSIDHIVPLSHGGDDVAVNKRAAHLGCNIARGNKSGAEQLMLFGSMREPPLVTRTVTGATARPPRPPKLCQCGAEVCKGSEFCQECLLQRRLEREMKVLPKFTAIAYYVCLGCHELRVKRAGSRRERCPTPECRMAAVASRERSRRPDRTCIACGELMRSYLTSPRHRNCGSPIAEVAA